MDLKYFGHELPYPTWVEVTAENLVNGIRRDWDRCAIKLACDNYCIPSEFAVVVTKEMKLFAFDFDKGRPLQPRRFATWIVKRNPQAEMLGSRKLGISETM